MRYLILLLPLFLLGGCYPYGYYGYGYGYPYGYPPGYGAGYQQPYYPSSPPPTYQGQPRNYGGQPNYNDGPGANSPANCGTPDQFKPCPPLPGTLCPTTQQIAREDGRRPVQGSCALLCRVNSPVRLTIALPLEGPLSRNPP